MKIPLPSMDGKQLKQDELYWGCLQSRGNKVTKHDSSRSELEHSQNSNKNEIFKKNFDKKERLVS